MARPGTRRYAVDLLYNMRLYDQSIKSIREGEQRLPQDLVTALKSFTAMTKAQKEQYSRGFYGDTTKTWSKIIRGLKGEAKEEARRMQRMQQIYAVQGKHALMPKQYGIINTFLKTLGYDPFAIRKMWGYEIDAG